MTTRTVNGSPTTYTINDRNQVTAVSGVGSATFDGNGNIISRVYDPIGPKNYNYVYDDENRLIEMRTDTYYTSPANRWKTEWVYDGLGRVRVRKEYIRYDAYQWYPNGETRYIYDGMRVVQERNSGNTPTVAYTRGNDLSASLEGAGGIGGLLARSHGYSGGNWSTHSFYHADGGGNVTMLLNSSQASVAQYRYDPFGRTISQSGTLAAANVHRFSSKEQHVKSGMYYYGYRFYEPFLQRWINRDPIGEKGDVNLYRFVFNGPSMWIDPLGEKGWRDTIVGIFCMIAAYFSDEKVIPDNPTSQRMEQEMRRAVDDRAESGRRKQPGAGRGRPPRIRGIGPIGAALELIPGTIDEIHRIGASIRAGAGWGDAIRDAGRPTIGETGPWPIY